MLHPQVGRFASRDPLGRRSGDDNPYRYVRNNAPNRVDPSGMFDTTPQSATNAIKGIFSTGYKAIQGQFVINASQSLNISSKFPALAGTEKSVNYVGIFIELKDTEQGKCCPGGRATRYWASMKYFLEHVVSDSSSGAQNEIEPKSKKWVADAGVKWPTDKIFHDGPGAAYQVFGPTQVLRFKKSYAVGIICLCDNDKSKAYKKARVTYHYSLHIDFQGPNVTVTMLPNQWYGSGWPEPGWAEAMGLTPVEQCP